MVCMILVYESKTEDENVDPIIIYETLLFYIHRNYVTEVSSSLSY